MVTYFFVFFLQDISTVFAEYDYRVCNVSLLGVQSATSFYEMYAFLCVQGVTSVFLICDVCVFKV